MIDTAQLAELLATPWTAWLIALISFGFAPRLLLTVLIRAWPPGHDRRAELIAEYYGRVPAWRRPLWTFEVAAAAVTEGLWERPWRRTRALRSLRPELRHVVLFDHAIVVVLLAVSVVGPHFIDSRMFGWSSASTLLVLSFFVMTAVLTTISVRLRLSLREYPVSGSELHALGQISSAKVLHRSLSGYYHSK